MRRPRRIVGLVLLSLGLGVVTTYGVAWWLLNRPGPMLGGLAVVVQIPPGSEPVGWDVYLEGIAGRIEVSAGVRDVDSRSIALAGWGSFTRVNGRPVLPRWSLLGNMGPNEIREHLTDKAPILRMVERAAGWPAFAVVERSCSDEASGLFPVRGYDATLRSEGGTLAFMPMWPGFAVDTLVFGLGWWALIVGPRWIRQRIRRRLRSRAGQCPKCRYDLSGLTGGVCPECGSAVKGM